MKHEIIELKYSNTNTYLIRGEKGYLLFDTGWAGTFQMFCRALGEKRIDIKDIHYILVSHYHPDHMGIAQNIALLGPEILVAEEQKEYIHKPDAVFQRENKYPYLPIEEKKTVLFSLKESRQILDQIGLSGEILHTPGHSDDSISLVLDQGDIFVGDLNPLYELELHKGTEIEFSWNKLLKTDPKCIHYGHAKTFYMKKERYQSPEKEEKSDLYGLVKQIMKLIDKGRSFADIQKKTKADYVFIEDVARMYLTHQNVGVQGILDRIEIKGK